MATAGRPFCSRRASNRTRIFLRQLNLGGVFDDEHPFLLRNESSEIDKSVVFPVPVPR